MTAGNRKHPTRPPAAPMPVTRRLAPGTLPVLACLAVPVLLIVAALVWLALPDVVRAFWPGYLFVAVAGGWHVLGGGL